GRIGGRGPAGRHGRGDPAAGRRPPARTAGQPGRADRRRHRAGGGRDPVHVPVPVAGVGLAEAAGPGLRQQADPVGAGAAQLRRRVGGRADLDVAVEHRGGRAGRGDRGDDQLGAGRLRLRLLPLPRAGRAVRAGARLDDAARRGHDGPGLPGVERHRSGRLAGAAVGGQPVRLGVLHLPAAAVLPRPAAGRVRGRPGGRARLRRAVLADRAAAVQAGADHHLRLRAAVELDRPGQAADLPAGPGALHAAARAQGGARPVRQGRREPVGGGAGRQRDRDRADADRLPDRPALLRPGHLHHRPHRL
ncbi:MAG: ABC transporter, permease protein 2 (cluster 1, maltose/g3p/polyamine/iron), partial [uncultured Corynebacteriales bacterium]